MHRLPLESVYGLQQIIKFLFFIIYYPQCISFYVVYDSSVLLSRTVLCNSGFEVFLHKTVKTSLSQKAS